MLVGLAVAGAQSGFDGFFGRCAADAAFQLAGSEAVPKTAAGDAHLNQT
jgi:hypothetical protein